MKTSFENSHATSTRRSNRDTRRLRNALARRKWQDLRDDQVLKSWLTEVWDQSTWSDEFDRNSRFH